MALAPTNWNSWATGDVVTQAKIQAMQDQSINKETTTTRDALSVDSGSEGAVIYNSTDKTLEVYSGSAWVPLLDLDTWSVSSGAYTIKGTVTVGVDDEGHNVVLYGDTANKLMTWDATNDILKLGASGGSAGVDFLAYGDTSGAYVKWQQADDYLLVYGGSLGVGTLTPVTAVEIASDDDLTDFTSANRGMFTLTNTDHATDDIVAMDFRYTTGAEEPSARIGAKMGGGGSSLIFGTSNDYAGITNEALVIDPSGKIGIGTDSPTDSQVHIVSGGEALRMERSGYDTYGFQQSAGSGIEFRNFSDSRTEMTFDGAGNVVIGATATTNGADFMVYGSTGRDLLVGESVTGNRNFTSDLVWDRTTATAENVNVNSSGYIRQSTSSERYKTDIEDLWDTEADLALSLRPVWFRSTADLDRSDWSHHGFIAEEVAEINPRWVHYSEHWQTEEVTDEETGETRTMTVLDADGNKVPHLDDDGEPVMRPEGVQYARIVPALVHLAQRQAGQIAELTARIEALEAQ